MYVSPNRTPEVKRRQDVEIRILKATVKALLDAGFTLSVFDGEEDLLLHRTGPETPVVGGSKDTKTIYNALYNTDEDYLNAWKGGHIFGWVRFVYGNDGWDVICDYTTNLEPYIGEGSAVESLIDEEESKAVNLARGY
jgi:hypothetical protein